MDTSSAATAANALLPTQYIVTDDASEALLSGPIAVALSAMTTGYYGWFWCGGVCPVDSVSGLGGSYVTDGTVAAGSGFCGVANASATSSNGDKIILKLVSLAHATGTLTQTYAAGISLIADA
jgi:hypothetical protein